MGIVSLLSHSGIGFNRAKLHDIATEMQGLQEETSVYFERFALYKKKSAY